MLILSDQGFALLHTFAPVGRLHKSLRPVLGRTNSASAAPPMSPTLRGRERPRCKQSIPHIRQNAGGLKELNFRQEVTESTKGSKNSVLAVLCQVVEQLNRRHLLNVEFHNPMRKPAPTTAHQFTVFILHHQPCRASSTEGGKLEPWKLSSLVVRQAQSRTKLAKAHTKCLARPGPELFRSTQCLVDCGNDSEQVGLVDANGLVACSMVSGLWVPYGKVRIVDGAPDVTREREVSADRLQHLPYAQ